MTREEYEWFRRSHRKQYCIMGNDYYITNEHLVDELGQIAPSGEQWANVHQLKRDGAPVVGFTWYSLTDQVDWDTTLLEDTGDVIHSASSISIARSDR